MMDSLYVFDIVLKYIDLYSGGEEKNVCFWKWLPLLLQFNMHKGMGL